MRKPPTPPTHYEVLGVEPTATAQEIKGAYRRAAASYHPDACTADPQEVRREREEWCKRVNVAYDVLSDPIRRRDYDAKLAAAADDDDGEEDEAEEESDDSASGAVKAAGKRVAAHALSQGEILGKDLATILLQGVAKRIARKIGDG